MHDMLKLYLRNGEEISQVKLSQVRSGQVKSGQFFSQL